MSQGKGECLLVTGAAQLKAAAADTMGQQIALFTPPTHHTISNCCYTWLEDCQPQRELHRMNLCQQERRGR